jgi:hypothetical protein
LPISIFSSVFLFLSFTTFKILALY